LIILRINVTKRIIGIMHLPPNTGKGLPVMLFIRSFIHSMLDLPLAMAHESF
jgi:hypothetical protein